MVRSEATMGTILEVNALTRSRQTLGPMAYKPSMSIAISTGSRWSAWCRREWRPIFLPSIRPTVTKVQLRRTPNGPMARRLGTRPQERRGLRVRRKAGNWWTRRARTSCEFETTNAGHPLSQALQEAVPADDQRHRTTPDRVCVYYLREWA